LKNLKALTLVLCVSTAIGIAHPAMAQDADDFAAKLAAAYGAVGYSLEFGPSTVDGTTISYDGLTVSLPAYGVTAEAPIKLDTVLTFKGVEEYDDGSYTAESLSIPDVNIDEDGVKVAAKALSVNGIYVPASADGGMMTVMQMVAGFNAGPITVSMADKEIFSVASITSHSDFTPEQGGETVDAIKGSMKIEGIKADLSTVTEAEPRAMIDALGINTITGSATQSFDWTMADGRIVSPMTVTLDNLGKIGFTIDISGYTAALMDEMMASQADLATLTEEERNAKEQQAALEMASKLSISGLSVRYDDASLAGKLLDVFAKQQGATRTDFVAGLKMIVPALLSQSPTPALNEQAAAAVKTFLDDPKSLEISINPGRAVGFMELAAGAQDPNAVVDLLKVKITANEAAQ